MQEKIIIQGKKPYQIDLPVLLIFFCRPHQFKQVFEQVKIAKPSKLFLYQDGPRENKNDMSGILECRRIAENIDWNCEIYKYYQEKNVGCDPSEFIAQKWAFSIVDRCVVLEDDDVPSQSFFPFCQELLERYKDDERINMICGMNHLGISENCPYDYFFSSFCSVWGWASWRRVIDTWDEHYSFLSNSYHYELLERKLKKIGYKNLISVIRNHLESGKAHYETIMMSSLYLNNRLNIIPRKNFISNIGISENATHARSSLSIYPKGLRRVFFMNTHTINPPINHPPYVIEDELYIKKVLRILGEGHPWILRYRYIETLLYRLFKKG